MSGLRPCSSPTPTAGEVARPARRAVRAGAGDARARPGRRRRGDRRRRPAHRAARGRRHAGRGAARPAGCWCRAASGTVVVPGEVGLALRGGHTTRRAGRRRAGAGDRPSATRAAGRRGRGGRGVRGGTPARAAARPLGRRAAVGAAQRRARRARPRATAAALHVDEPTAGAARRDRLRVAGCWPPLPTAPATRCGCRPTWSTPGCCGRPRSGGPGWPAPGWTARGCRGWSAPATPPARPWNALAPELAGVHMAETRR